MKYPLPKTRITIRMTVVTAFILATVLTAAVAIGLQYYFGSRLATSSTQRIYNTASQGIAAELRNISDKTRHLLELLGENTALAEGAVMAEHIPAFTRLMQENPLFYGIYVGTPDGGFFEIVNLESSPRARDALQAQPRDRWVTIRIEQAADERFRRYQYLDGELTPLRERREPTDYDVVRRQWYADAVSSDTLQRSKPYRFAQLGALGQTVSKRISGTEAVVAIDITLESMSRFLGALNIGESSQVLLYDKSGEIIASSKPGNSARDVADPELVAMALDSTRQEQLIEVDTNAAPYYAFSAAMSNGDTNGLYVGILAPKASVVGPLLDRVRVSILVTSGLLLLLLPLSWFFASPIVKPVRQLALENEKVRRRDYDGVQRVPTHIYELDQLSDSMVTMVGAIRDHEKAQEDLIESIIKLIAEAIDDKSPYTGGHCERVPELALMLVRRASSSDEPPFDSFRLETEDEWREFRIAAWLHDCGKITTPEHVVDKGSKLETIYNRIHEVRMRFEVLWRDAEIAYWQKLNGDAGNREQLAEELESRKRELQKDFAFIARCNVGGEFLHEEDRQRLRELGKTTWRRHFDNTLGLSPLEEVRMRDADRTLPATEPLLSDRPEHIIDRPRPADYPDSLGINMSIPEHMYNQGELHNLTVSRGTLTEEDRFKINEHMISTIRMLEGLPFPEELSNVPRYASTHHETMKGTGYPRRLSGDQLSIPERLLAIADVFEALTAADRPYKKAKTVREALDILHHMVQDDHLDRDCFELFVREEIYLDYARRFLAPDQIDPVEKNLYLDSGKAVEHSETSARSAAELH